MKDGRIVEQGTHKELIAPRDNEDPGEYFKLYEIQAQAFN
jgi:ABC-type multidrug transport system fused ATPase/permease subunit